MTDLAEFLLARFAEDEEVARGATAGPWHWDPDYKEPGDDGTGLALVGADNAEVVGAYNYHCCSFRDDPCVEDNDQAHIARHDPTRVLAECEAKRRIVERYAHLAEHGDSGDARWLLPLLALPYADHPDYREEWMA